ncbi:Hypothetical predicted protein [Lecanosticta acicola]|uniref:DUF2231 domain-containing protein n=1 Tax=Lecanosticta acicola TaxID=111012 RepID=A0AAI8Z2M0_9PEZI|nr:Hypothetical predicted protein [Lecanosticta acicola]
MAKPVHPATVHFPIAFIFLSAALDILNTLRNASLLPASVTTQLLAPNDLTRASYYLLALGLLTSIPAVVTGGGEAMKMIQKQGMYESDNKTIKPKVKATIAHAVVNDVVIAVNTYVWYTRRANARDSLLGKMGTAGGVGTAASAYAPETWMVAAQGVALGLMLFGANIGGALTYNYGVGFSSMNNSLASGVAARKSK